MPVSAAALAAEIESGPLAEALAPLVAAGDDAGAAALLNRRADAFDPPAAWAVYRAAVPRGELLEVVAGLDAVPTIKAAEAESSVAWAALRMLENPASALDFTRAGTRQLVAALDLVSAGLGTALTALGSRPASRAEVLGGEGYAVTDTDVGTARNLGG